MLKGLKIMSRSCVYALNSCVLLTFKTYKNDIFHTLLIKFDKNIVIFYVLGIFANFSYCRFISIYCHINNSVRRKIIRETLLNI